MKGNPELESLETIRHMTPQNLQSLGRFLVTLPFPTPESFLPPYETVFREACNCYVVTSKSNQINLRFNLLPGVFRNTRF